MVNVEVESLEKIYPETLQPWYQISKLQTLGGVHIQGFL